MSAHPVLPSPVPTSRLVTASGRELPLRAADVRAEAAAGLAVVTVEQVFHNPFAEPLEVTYQLPLPADAAVGGFAIQVGDERIEGVVQGRDQARATYEDALFEGRTAGLLEADRDGLFTQTVGNVPPGAEVRVTVRLDQPLAWEHGGWTWRFPTVVAPRYVDGATPDADRLAVDVADAPLPARLSASLTVHDACTGAPTSSSHTLDVTGDVVSLGGGVARLDRDVVVRWPVSQPEVGATAWWGAVGEERLGSVVLVPPRVPGASVARDLIVLLDISGSMVGAPLQQAVRVTQRLVKSLGPSDSLELITFGSVVKAWRPEPVAATPAVCAEAVTWLDGLRAAGGTSMDKGIRSALAGLRDDAQRQVLLITDGHIGFEARVVGLIAAGLGRSSRLHVLGVGQGVNRSLTRAAARTGRGVEVIVAPDEDVQPALDRVLNHLDQPQVVDLVITGDALIEAAPANLPDLFAGAPARLALRCRPGRLCLTGQTAAGPWSTEVVVPEQAPERAALGRLWAREAVADAETQRARGQDVDSRVEALGLRWGIATRLTSFVAVSTQVNVDPTRPIRAVTVPHELPAGMSAEGLGLRSAGVPVKQPMAMPSAPPPAMRSRKLMAPRSAGGAPPPPPSMESAVDDLDAPSAAPREVEEAEEPASFFERTTAPLRRFEGSSAPKGSSPITIACRSHRYNDGRLTVRWAMPMPTDWTLPQQVTVTLSNGRTLTLTVDPDHSTAPSQVSPGLLLTLCLVVDEATADRLDEINLPGLTVTLR